MIRAAFFDLDDTLCAYWDASKRALKETFELHAPDGVDYPEMVQAWAEAFRKFSPELKKRETVYQTYLREGGPTRIEQMRLTLRELGLEDEDRAIALGGSYGTLRLKYLQLFPEAREVLDAFKARMPIGVITNGPADIQREEINALGLNHDFQVELIEGELGFGKPDPRVYELALELISAFAPKLQPSEILMVGNSYGHDILGALKAGWQTAWIRRASDFAPSATEPESKPEHGPEPTATIGDLRELLTAIASDEHRQVR